MSSLGEQLKALDLRRTGRKNPVVDSSRPGAERPRSGQEKIFLTLPRCGTVARLEKDRGFGFISSDNSEDIFFRFRGYPGRLPDGQKLPPVGSPVLFIAGSDPRRPD